MRSRLAIEAGAAAAQLRGYEATGREVSWADAAVNASAAANPRGREADLFNGLAERLAAEYNTEQNIVHWIDSHESLPNQRAYVNRSQVDESLQKLATAIVESADHGAPGTYQRPDPIKIGAVRDAMAQRLDDSRTGNPPADGPGTYGERLGRETAQAGIQAVNKAKQDAGLTRTLNLSIGAQAAPGTAPATTEQNGNTSQNPATHSQTKSTGLGGRG
ncbi:hypothetical protein [Kribbella solani]|uniref:Uncharacterized protein n=1 Tax=Kribbella solani TaxID=236067 RepID=A0A841DV79_9ACTN|nr:hypothetical protein [Kribbella solani]MBB5982503.1 hypothetical protein [Kribbella solani]